MHFKIKHNRVLGLILIGLFLIVQVPCAIASEGLPQEIQGKGTEFIFNTRTGKVTVPDCILLEAQAFCTKWEMDDSYFLSGEYINVFKHLSNAKVSEIPKLKPGKYDPYEYAGLQLFVQSTKDSTISARIRLWPRNQDDYPDYQDIVDMEIVFYHNYNQPDEKIVLKEYQLTSYDLWNSIVRYTMEFYELSALKNTVRIEYHSLRNDPDAHATPSANPPTLQNNTSVNAIIDELVQGEKLDHNMAGLDYMHLRCIDENGKTMNIYLQEPRNESSGKIYARMGAYCYRIDKNDLQQALNAAGIPWEMMM